MAKKKPLIHEIVRTVKLSPYRKGMGPTFQLDLWDAGKKWESNRQRQYVGYRLIMREAGKPALVLFRGEDIGLGMFSRHSLDSDETVRSVLSWLTLKPGDTDADFFANYTSEQLAFCDAHADALSIETLDRFGEE